MAFVLVLQAGSVIVLEGEIEVALEIAVIVRFRTYLGIGVALLAAVVLFPFQNIDVHGVRRFALRDVVVLLCGEVQTAVQIL